jgi:hypothetical protein
VLDGNGLGLFCCILRLQLKQNVRWQLFDGLVTTEEVKQALWRVVAEEHLLRPLLAVSKPPKSPFSSTILAP